MESWLKLPSDDRVLQQPSERALESAAWGGSADREASTCE